MPSPRYQTSPRRRRTRSLAKVTSDDEEPPPKAKSPTGRLAQRVKPARRVDSVKKSRRHTKQNKRDKSKSNNTSLRSNLEKGDAKAVLETKPGKQKTSWDFRGKSLVGDDDENVRKADPKQMRRSPERIEESTTAPQPVRNKDDDNSEAGASDKDRTSLHPQGKVRGSTSRIQGIDKCADLERKQAPLADDSKSAEQWGKQG